MKNAKQRTIHALQLLGCVEQFDSKKYRTFATKSQKFLVGKAGALRMTKTTVNQSVSLTDSRTHKNLKILGEFPQMDVSLARETYQNIRVA